jgi:hypothetical protein
VLQIVSTHQFDRRYNDPVRWPSYFLIRQRAINAAARLKVKVGTAERRRLTGGNGPIRSGTEKRLVARAGKLVGRPDRFDRTSVTDYKSNLPDAETPFGSEILKRYRRQIRIYAAIIAEALAFWPKKGIIAAPPGISVVFDLDPSECDSDADRAVRDLEEWNAALSSAQDADHFANPSASSCLNCRFQLVCPAFWNWLERVPTPIQTPGTPVAAAGKLKAVQLGNDKDLQTITLANVISTLPGVSEVSMVNPQRLSNDDADLPFGRNPLDRRRFWREGLVETNHVRQPRIRDDGRFWRTLKQRWQAVGRVRHVARERNDPTHARSPEDTVNRLFSGTS